MLRIRDRKYLSLLLIAALSLLLIGCGENAQVPECAHEFGQLRPAVAADFFQEGSIAYYTCALCNGRFNEQLQQIDTVVIPKASTNLSVCVNGVPFVLSLDRDDGHEINWSLDCLAVEAGDVITLCDTADPAILYPFTGADNILADGTVIESTAKAEVSLTASADGLTLSVSDGKYPGVVARINGEEYPMYQASEEAVFRSAYLYGFAELKAGDTVSVSDNIQKIIYGYQNLASEELWNHSDYHAGGNGELVFDKDGRYLLALDKEGKLYLTKVSAPMEGDHFTVIFGEQRKKVQMERVDFEENTDAFKTFSALFTHEIIKNTEDITQFLDENGISIYVADIYLEAGAQLYLENTQTAAVIGAANLSDVSGPENCVTAENGRILINQTGTYHIEFQPWCGSITIKQSFAGTVYQAATAFDKRIAAIPSYTELYHMDEIKSLYRDYLCLSGSVRYNLKTVQKLKTMYQTVQLIEADTQSVRYYMHTADTRNVYTSKEALFKGFFTDFYYYIAACYGTEELAKCGVKSAQDFVALAKDFNGVGVTDLAGIGYVAGSFFLESRSNNILDNQTDRGFLGFCWQNGMYRDILPFFINYFAFWRLDEHFANATNSGADMLVEGWAATVDIAKFFYYDVNTSYVKTDRVLDCFANAAGVVYGLEEGQALPQIRMRGYIFEGWYDNPEFAGEAITNSDDVTEGMSLYAKWRYDDAQRDLDDAARVDIYIYNLTTQRAYRNANTVGYVKAMYDALSENGKSLVQDQATYEWLVKTFMPKE